MSSFAKKIFGDSISKYKSFALHWKKSNLATHLKDNKDPNHGDVLTELDHWANPTQQD
jgi:hypothetical protein